MKLKRSFVVLLALSIITAMLAGCGTAASPSAVETTAGTVEQLSEAAPEAAVAEKPVVLTRWIVAATRKPFDEAQTERFTKMYPNILLNDVMVVEGDGTDQMAAFAAGNNPDLAGTGFPQLAKFVYAGVTLPLDEYTASWPDLANMKPEVLDNLRFGGKLHAIPDGAYQVILNYNKKIFADAGVAAPPKTWDELLATATKLTDPTKQQWGFNLIQEWNEWWFEWFVWMAGGDLTKENPDGTVTLTFTDPAVKTAIEFYRKLIAAKAIQPDLTMGYGDMQKAFSTGNAAMTLNGSDALNNYVNDGMKAEDIGYAELPVGPSGKPVGQIGGATMYIFSNVSKEKADAAWKWIAFRASKEEKEAELADHASRGGANPQVIVRTDVDTSIGKVNPEYQAVVDKMTLVSRKEFYAKGTIGGFIADAVKKASLDPSSDIVKVFTAAQKAAQVEADNFNKAVLETKKK